MDTSKKRLHSEEEAIALAPRTTGSNKDRSSPFLNSAAVASKRFRRDDGKIAPAPKDATGQENQVPPVAIATAASTKQIRFNDEKMAAQLAGVSPTTLVQFLLKAAQEDEDRKTSLVRSNPMQPGVTKKDRGAPEYLVPLLPPASDNAADDETFLRAFWNHTRNHSQHWTGDTTPAHAKSGAPIYEKQMIPKGLARTGDAWNRKEDQVLFDSTLKGNGWHGMACLANLCGRTDTEILKRMEELRGVRLPTLWHHSHAAAQTFVRDRTGHGENNLSADEWRELVIWVYRGYNGLNPSVFDGSRCTERLRKEVRVLDDLDAKLVIRCGRHFLQERAGQEANKRVNGFREVRARKKQKVAAGQEVEEAGANQTFCLKSGYGHTSYQLHVNDFPY